MSPVSNVDRRLHRQSQPVSSRNPELIKAQSASLTHSKAVPRCFKWFAFDFRGAARFLEQANTQKLDKQSNNSTTRVVSARLGFVAHTSPKMPPGLSRTRTGSTTDSSTIRLRLPPCAHSIALFAFIRQNELQQQYHLHLPFACHPRREKPDRSRK